MRIQRTEESVRQGLAMLSESGALVVKTGAHTGRAANSRFVVRNRESESTVDWGDVNKPFDAGQAETFFAKLQKNLIVQSLHEVTSLVGAFKVTVKTPSPWHAIFAENMFRGEAVESLRQRVGSLAGKSMEVWHDPMTKASDYGITAAGDAFILLDLETMRVGIVGTQYAGEIKKSAFSMCNYLLPSVGVLPMHASANCLEDGSNACVLFGLSGTGKTTLSADPNRWLVGDDEIIWSDKGLTNLEGGCYAKLINLSVESEPEIFKAVNSFGAIMENVVVCPQTRKPNFDDKTLAENSRGSYKLSALSKVFDQTKEASAPKRIVFLTADAFGALPAVARLDAWQTQYHFMSGYTAKVAGTELGVTEPKAAFSACFGAPFMPRPPSVYATLLAKKVQETGASVWLLNTGWWGGYKDGKRFPLKITRTLLEMIQNGSLDKVEMVKHPIFGFEVPKAVDGLDAQYFEIPSGAHVEKLAALFDKNMDKFKTPEAQEIRRRGGPTLGTPTARANEASV